MLYEVGYDDDLLKMTTKAQATKEKKQTSSKLKIYASRNIIK